MRSSLPAPGARGSENFAASAAARPPKMCGYFPGLNSPVDLEIFPPDILVVDLRLMADVFAIDNLPL